MILVRNLRLEPGEDLSRLSAKAAKKLRVGASDIAECRVIKRSLDARKKNDIHYTCSAAVTLRAGEDKLLARLAGKDVCAYAEPVYDIPRVESASRPVVVGFGPAGMFAALVLARAGARPIVLERGQDALSRKAAVDAFRAGGEKISKSAEVIPVCGGFPPPDSGSPVNTARISRSARRLAAGCPCCGGDPPA